MVCNKNKVRVRIKFKFRRYPKVGYALVIREGHERELRVLPLHGNRPQGGPKVVKNRFSGPVGVGDRDHGGDDDDSNPPPGAGPDATPSWQARKDPPHARFAHLCRASDGVLLGLRLAVWVRVWGNVGHVGSPLSHNGVLVV